MSTLTLNDTSLNRYLRVLQGFDKATKKKLIKRLLESLEEKNPEKNPNELFGAWQDNRSAEEIIEDIYKARTASRPIEDFE